MTLFEVTWQGQRSLEVKLLVIWRQIVIVMVALFQIAPAWTGLLRLQPNLDHRCTMGTFTLWRTSRSHFWMLSISFYHYLKTKIWLVYTVLSSHSHVTCEVWEVSCQRSQLITQWFLLMVFNSQALSFLNFVDFETTVINRPNRCEFTFIPKGWKTVEHMAGKGEAYASKVAKANSAQHNM